MSRPYAFGVLPSAEWYFPFFPFVIFVLSKRKNDKHT
jgi:hypothetical protein